MKPCRLIYRSIADEILLKNQELSKLVTQAANHNRKIGICGLLVLSDNKFLQLLEGPPKFVNELYCRITQDKKHSEVELISYESVVHPEFLDWSMHLLELDKIEPNVKNLLAKKYPLVDDKFQFPHESFLMTSFLMDLKHVLPSN